MKKIKEKENRKMRTRSKSEKKEKENLKNGKEKDCITQYLKLVQMFQAITITLQLLHQHFFPLLR